MQSLRSGDFAKAMEQVTQQREADSEDVKETRQIAPAKVDAKNSSRQKSSRPGSRMSSHTRHRGVPLAAPSTVIRLDLDEEEDDANADTARESSLARGYNALGVEFHCMGNDKLLSPKAPQPNVCRPPAFPASNAPVSRQGSRFGALRHRAALEVA